MVKWQKYLAFFVLGLSVGLSVVIILSGPADSRVDASFPQALRQALAPAEDQPRVTQAARRKSVSTERLESTKAENGDGTEETSEQNEAPLMGTSLEMREFLTHVNAARPYINGMLPRQDLAEALLSAEVSVETPARVRLNMSAAIQIHANLAHSLSALYAFNYENRIDEAYFARVAKRGKEAEKRARKNKAQWDIVFWSIPELSSLIASRKAIVRVILLEGRQSDFLSSAASTFDLQDDSFAFTIGANEWRTRVTINKTNIPSQLWGSLVDAHKDWLRVVRAEKK